jgi:hypothetical protein
MNEFDSARDRAYDIPMEKNRIQRADHAILSSVRHEPGEVVLLAQNL